jgi:thymidylate synthase ThyX
LWDADITDVDQLEDQLESKQIFEMVERYSKVRYKALVPILERYLQRKGVDKQTARKQARGAARGILGNALETTMVWTANLRALRNVIEQRASRFADAEIRLLGNLLLKLAWGVCPEYFSDYSEKNCKDGIGFGVETECRKI